MTLRDRSTSSKSKGQHFLEVPMVKDIIYTVPICSMWKAKGTT